MRATKKQQSLEEKNVALYLSLITGGNAGDQPAPADVGDLDQAELCAKLMRDGMSFEAANGLAYSQIVARDGAPAGAPPACTEPLDLAEAAARLMREGMSLEDSNSTAYKLLLATVGGTDVDEALRLRTRELFARGYEYSAAIAQARQEILGGVPQPNNIEITDPVNVGPLPTDRHIQELFAEVFDGQDAVSVIKVGDFLVARMPLIGGALSPRTLEQLSRALEKAGY